MDSQTEILMPILSEVEKNEPLRKIGLSEFGTWDRSKIVQELSPDGITSGYLIVSNETVYVVPYGRTITVGRSSRSDIVVIDPLVSSDHMTIQGRSDPRNDLTGNNETMIYIIDKSTNGTNVFSDRSTPGKKISKADSTISFQYESPETEIGNSKLTFLTADSATHKLANDATSADFLIQRATDAVLEIESAVDSRKGRYPLRNEPFLSMIQRDGGPLYIVGSEINAAAYSKGKYKLVGTIDRTGTDPEFMWMDATEKPNFTIKQA